MGKALCTLSLALWEPVLWERRSSNDRKNKYTQPYSKVEGPNGGGGVGLLGGHP